MNIKPIQTIYKGYKFRSRLEARYAVFFDKLGIQWEYEHQDYMLENGERYLPDFWLPEQDCYIEIKGQVPTWEERRKAILLALQEYKRVCIFYGRIWVPGLDDTYEEESHYHGFTFKKGAECLDPCSISLVGNDTASPCYEYDKCPHEDLFDCPAYREIYYPGSPEDKRYGKLHLAKEYAHLIRAIYMAHAILGHGDSDKLRLTRAGDLQFLSWDEGQKKRVSAPIPPIIEKYRADFVKVLSSKPTWEWGIGVSDLFAGNPFEAYRWCKCPVCGKLNIASNGDARELSCYRLHSEEDRGSFEEFNDNTCTDDTSELITAYTAARQARFEHGEVPI